MAAAAAAAAAAERAASDPRVKAGTLVVASGEKETHRAALLIKAATNVDEEPRVGGCRQSECAHEDESLGGRRIPPKIILIIIWKRSACAPLFRRDDISHSFVNLQKGCSL